MQGEELPGRPAFKLRPCAADFLDMPSGVRFADVLEERLGAARAESPRRESRAPHHYAPDPSLLFFETRFRPTSAPAPLPQPPPPAAPRLRPRRSLTSRQRDALSALWGLGARIGMDFSEAELRSDYRALARRYHPDRHPGVSAVESARLARIFANLTDCYRQLLPAAS